MRDKYWLWSVQPQGGSALLFVGLGRKKDIIARWRELTANKGKNMPIELHHRVGKYGNGLRVKFVAYRTFDWKPDCLAEMLTLRGAHPWLMVEDLT